MDSDNPVFVGGTGELPIGIPVSATNFRFADMATLQINAMNKEVARVCAPDVNSETPWTVRTPKGLVARFVAKSDAELFARIIARDFLAGG